MAEKDHETEKLKGTAKELAGKVIGDDDKVREGQAQQERADAAEDAEQLEREAQKRKQQAAGKKGEQVKHQD